MRGKTFKGHTALRNQYLSQSPVVRRILVDASQQIPPGSKSRRSFGEIQQLIQSGKEAPLLQLVQCPITSKPRSRRLAHNRNDAFYLQFVSLTEAGVHKTIHAAANSGGLEYALADLAKKVQDMTHLPDVEAEALVQEYTELVHKAVGTVSWKAIIKNKIGIITKELANNKNGIIRRRSITTLGMLRSKFAAHKAISRQK